MALFYFSYSDTGKGNSIYHKSAYGSVQGNKTFPAASFMKMFTYRVKFNENLFENILTTCHVRAYSNTMQRHLFENFVEKVIIIIDIIIIDVIGGILIMCNE